MINRRKSKSYNQEVLIYALTDLQGNTFYVGQTFRALEVRLHAHIIEAKSNRPCTNKLKSQRIRDLNYQVLIVELDRIYVSGDSLKIARRPALKLEEAWIKKMAKSGARLTNFGKLQSGTKIMIVAA